MDGRKASTDAGARTAAPLWLLLWASLAASLLAATPAAAGELDHATGIEALRERMRRIAELMYERTLTPLEVDRERLRQAAAVADIAGELAAAADALVQSPEGAIADETRRRLFRDNAQRLAGEAAELRRLAELERVGEMPAQLERLAHACALCHSEFRPSVPLR